MTMQDGEDLSEETRDKPPVVMSLREELRGALPELKVQVVIQQLPDSLKADAVAIIELLIGYINRTKEARQMPSKRQLRRRIDNCVAAIRTAPLLANAQASAQAYEVYVQVLCQRIWDE